MTPIADPRRAVSSALFIATAVVAVAVGAALAWIIIPPVLPAVPTGVKPATVAASPAASARLDAAVWSVTLWRSLGDEPASGGGAASPVKIFSIVQQGEERIAALDFDDGPLIYAKAGDTVRAGLRVKSVEPSAVVLEVGGTIQRVGLAP